MPIGSQNSQLRDKKDHFVVTLYKTFREKLEIRSSSILLLNVNGHELIKIPNKDYHVTIPKKLITNNANKISLKIIKIYDVKKAKLRDNKLFFGNCANIEAFVPNKTLFGNDIFVLNNGVYSYIWYNISGGAKHIKIKNKFNAERLAELIGFYFGDGNTSLNIRSFRLNNCEPSTLNYCLDILEELGVPRKTIKLQIIYSTPKDKISDILKEKCINYWSRILNINNQQIVSVNRSYGKTESLEHGSARIFFDNAVFVEVLLNGILKKFIEIIKNPKTKIEKKLLEGFLRGLAAAEGSVTLTKLNSLSRIGLAYNPHSADLIFYKKILENLGIKVGNIHGNELLIYGINNFRLLKDINLFKMHHARREKFLKGYIHHRFSH
ncbi:MAG: hypothetical protein Q8L27_05135 [archaeon]|nr:hypothetical protein [archaeon]